MKTEEQLNTEIFKITMTIKEKYPELSRHITEMPIKHPEVVSSEIAVKGLKDYYDSLVALLNKYDENHATTQTTKI